ncbi:plastid transcriptionally active 5 [Melia azedarach]|uniref:Plastid transcriptionally active 5 n=1 Tax=Melia azedarach TaxID=155640 RepID=A0ACC1YII5_MELAZ|nr:plastid transcriptionally active 5 [Melia azedarach]
MSSLLPLSLNLPPLTFHFHRKTYSPLFISFSRTSKLQIHATSSNSDHEEIRWLREEQRWLREEQRWLREEQRWLRERESLLREISELKLQIQALENRNLNEGASVSDTISNIAGLLQVLKDKNLIAERATVVEEKIEEEEQEQQKEVVSVFEGEKKKMNTLRTGSEGEEVKLMQEALEKLGFYSGEEDIEYSSFSSGTERAVKTWQATIGAREDGIMTSELLERLYMEQRIDTGTNTSTDEKGTIPTVPPKEGTNGAAIASVTEISEIQQTVVQSEGVTEVDVSQKRVFLLGENRWEEPSRLAGRNSQVIGSKTSKATTKCITCRGEGRLMCTECDGTGEPNVEPQFLEWVDEGAKCPYCEGLGYTICDVCDGKTVI